MLRKALALSAFLLALLPLSAHAHGWVVAASTPYNPPITLFWITPLFIVLSMWLDWRYLTHRPHIIRIILANIVLTILMYVLVVFGVYFFSLEACFFSHPLHRYSWEPNGLMIFLVGNLSLWLFFNMAKRAVLNYYRAPKPEVTMALRINAYLYFAIMVVFLSLSSSIHGWAGGYIVGGCEGRLSLMEDAIVKYAIENGNRLPKAQSIDELYTQIHPYLERQISPEGERGLLVCPVERKLNIHPRKYTWDNSLSGITVEELRKRSGNVAISCPAYYIPIHGRFEITAGDLLACWKELTSPTKTAKETSGG